MVVTSIDQLYGLFEFNGKNLFCILCCTIWFLSSYAFWIWVILY
jgi:hypothetical protein